MPPRSVNPHSPPRSPGRRHALTLAEVLIAIGILSLGLLGVAAVFPVGGYYMQSGDTSVRGNAIAQAALEDAIIRGHLDPRNWVVHSVLGPPFGFVPFLEGDAQRPGLASPVPRPQRRVFGQNSRNDEEYRARAFGHGFVIDPFGVGSILARTLNPSGTPDYTTVTNPSTSAAVRRFPASGFWNHTSAAWEPWYVNSATWPIRRVTTSHAAASLNSTATFAFQEPTAEAMFRSDDDLSLQLPEQGDVGARQFYDAWANGLPSLRVATGDYSWFLTVSPETSAARDALATAPASHPVEVSAVVVRKREVGGVQDVLQSERLALASVVSRGAGTAELLLRRPASEPDATGFFEQLREGHYVMLCGPHPLSVPRAALQPDPEPAPRSAPNGLRFAMHWCRILSIEDEDTATIPPTAGGGPAINFNLDRDSQVLVAVRGPDLPWAPAEDLQDPDQLSNDLRVAIVPGAVAVHTQTMRLESGSEWSIE